MNGLDIGILVCLFLSALTGVIYGFLNIVFSIIAWACALGVAVKASVYIAPLLENHVESLLLRDMLAFVGLFIVSLMLLTAIGYCIARLFGRGELTVTDRILGFGLGLGLGGTIVVVLVFLAGFTAISSTAWWQRSLLVEPFQHIAVWGSQFLPADVAAYHRYGSE